MGAQLLRVLVVEDRAEDAVLAIRELRRAALNCETRRVDAADAFRRALVDFKPHIVLADYTVPGFGGMHQAGAADYVLKTNLIRLGPAVSGALAFAQSRMPLITRASNRAATCCSPSPIRASGWTTRRKHGSSSRFSPPRSAARETGLGLATVYGIVQQTGGHIWPYSEPGRGTTMRVYLPRVDEPADPIERPGNVAPETLRGSETILLVEDEAPVRAVTRQLLERNGYTVLEAPEGAAALALVAGERGSRHVDLLLTDVIMPGMSGRELADQLKARRPELRVLFMSGYTDDRNVRDVLQRKLSSPKQNPKKIDNIDIIRRVRAHLIA